MPAPRILTVVALAALMVLRVPATAQSTDSGALAIRITSPQGRSGLRGAIRIVAQVRAPEGAAVGPVRFYVDGALLGEDLEGPVYAQEWVDENPFVARQLAVEVSDEAGRVARDAVDLKPFEVIEASQITSILLETSVQDDDGRFVTGLAATDFELRENDVVQKIDLVRPEVLPATYTLLVDASQSMSYRLDFVREAAGHILDHLREQDRVLVVPFKRTLGAITGPTNDFATVADAINTLDATGGTAIADALVELSQRLGAIEGRHVVVLVTDGYDEDSARSFGEALEAVRRIKATLYVIGVGGSAGISLDGEDRLRQLAVATGGKAYFPARETELPDVHGRVTSDVEHRYLITYTPSNQRPDGAWRAISLRTKDGTRKVRTREGYEAPRPPPLRATLEFAIRDQSRRFLEISADDLEVFEDGVKQRIEGFNEATAPVSIVLALDQSGSMKPSAEPAKAAARTFVDAVRPEDSLGLVLFADRAVFAHDLTKERVHSHQAVDGYVPLGGTALYDAIYDALLRLKHAETRRVVVVVTDGKDENNPGTAPGSVRTLQQVLALLRDVDATVYTIGIGKKVERGVLETLARLSGGESYFPDDVSSLAGDFKRVVENLRRRYLLSYLSSNPERDGSWRAVEIKTAFPDVLVKSRGGYFAPAQ